MNIHLVVIWISEQGYIFMFLVVLGVKLALPFLINVSIILSKYAIEIWSWRTLFWMEALHQGWKFVTLVIQRYEMLKWFFLKIPMFFVWAYSVTVDWLQSSLLHSRPKSTVGTPAYIAPEVLSRREYDGKVSLLIFLIRSIYVIENCLVS